MSEQGWRNFLAAQRVVRTGLCYTATTAVFRVRSVVEAARLAEAIAHIPGLDGAGVLMAIADGQLTVRLTRGVERLEERHVQLARVISAVAREHGAVADRTRTQQVQLAIPARPDEIDVGFWRAVLGYVELADDNAIDPLGHGSTVWMQDLDHAKPSRNAMHVDVSVGRERAEHRVAAAVAAGGRTIEDSHAPAAWILADSAGNRVCIARRLARRRPGMSREYRPVRWSSTPVTSLSSPNGPRRPPRRDTEPAAGVCAATEARP